MTEIPEHLLKRAQAAREKAAAESSTSSSEPEASSAAAEGSPDVTASEQPAGDPRIPAHLLERSRAARAQAGGGGGGDAEAGGGGGAVAVADRVAEVVQAPPAAPGVPLGAG